MTVYLDCNRSRTNDIQLGKYLENHTDAIENVDSEPPSTGPSITRTTLFRIRIRLGQLRLAVRADANRNRRDGASVAMNELSPDPKLPRDGLLLPLP